MDLECCLRVIDLGLFLPRRFCYYRIIGSLVCLLQIRVADEKIILVDQVDEIMCCTSRQGDLGHLPGQ